MPSLHVQATEPLMLELLAGAPFLDVAAVALLLPDPSLLDDLDNYVRCLDLPHLRASAATSLALNLNGLSLELKLGTDVFLSYSDMLAAQK